MILGLANTVDATQDVGVGGVGEVMTSFFISNVK